jgi:hypothetical protein
MKLSPHNKHIKKLIEQGLTDREIQTEIRKIFDIPFKISDIQNKRPNELNKLIKPFRDNSIELLYPILYKGFPDRNFIREKLEQIINYLIDAIKTVENFPSEDVLIDLLLVFENGSNTYKHDAFLYCLIYQYKTKNKKKLEESREIQQLKAQLEDPFKFYFLLSNISMEHLSFREESSEFDSIIREVCRDNIVTKKERAYLEEKAAEYFINPDKLKIYLDNPFLGHETFKIFIDQICEDGVVTDTERQYINEKAKQYNVPPLILEKMISEGILRAQFSVELSQNNNFYEIVLIYLFANTFNIKIVKEKISDYFLKQDENNIATKELANKKNKFFLLLQGVISEKQDFFGLKTLNKTTIFQYYETLDIETKKLSYLTQQSKIDKKETSTSLEWEYIIDNNITAPITINYLEKKVVIKNDKSKFQTFINSLFKERDKHRGPEVDLFFENFEDFYNEI